MTSTSFITGAGLKKCIPTTVMLQACANLGDGKGGGVGSEDTVCLADSVQLLEGLFLDLHVLHSRLNDQIAVAADILNAGL